MSHEARPRVLFADDHVGIVAAARSLLEPHCEVVGHAADGESALEDARGLRPDVVVVDLNLPKLNGLEVCRRLGSASGMRTVLITATDDPDIREIALITPGVSAFVLKRSLATELEPAVRKAWREAIDSKS